MKINKKAAIKKVAVSCFLSEPTFRSAIGSRPITVAPPRYNGQLQKDGCSGTRNSSPAVLEASAFRLWLVTSVAPEAGIQLKVARTNHERRQCVRHEREFSLRPLLFLSAAAATRRPPPLQPVGPG